MRESEEVDPCRPSTSRVQPTIEAFRHTPARKLLSRLWERATGELVLRTRFRSFPPRRREPGSGGWPSAYELQLPSSWEARSACEDVVNRSVGILGHTVDPISPESADGIGVLGQYHAHYLEWLWPLVVSDRARHLGRALDLWLRWEETHGQARGASWAPYATATRAWTLCALGSACDRADIPHGHLDGVLGRYRTYLRWMPEAGLGGNHRIRNLKARIGLALYFGDDPSTLVQLLTKTLTSQLLNDGGHCERSPSYHAQVCGDVLDVCEVLEASSQKDLAIRLSEPIERMTQWLGLVRHKDGSLPWFNDSPRLPPDYLERLPLSRPMPGSALSDSGFRRLESESFVVLLDGGAPGPKDLPGHAHVEIGAFEVSDHTGPVIRNLGTSTYGPGTRRQLERGSLGHTALILPGRPQAEIWASFRMGRRVTTTAIHEDRSGVLIRHEAHEGLSHEREVTVDDNIVSISDQLAGPCGVVDTSVRLYTEVIPVRDPDDHRAMRLGDFVLRHGQQGVFVVTPVDLADQMGVTKPGFCMELDCSVRLPGGTAITISHEPRESDAW